ncbi:Arylsulfatase [Planctomycetes bacterium MalM25]|nr:Arylsulfatase [Planctomycetes bacterium MalM25]
MRLALIALWCGLAADVQSADRPNILWITSEDNGPQMGCYGDAFADTPHLDALATRGVCYDNAWSNAPVCSAARSTILTGCYPPRLGAQHHRAWVEPPEWLSYCPTLMRGAGYFCTNPAKTDYNFATPGGDGGKALWDKPAAGAPWRGRAEGQPFFAVVNFTTTHESQTRKRPHTPVHEAADVPLPPYWPDTPVVRKDWAQYYDKMTEMDAQAGALLAKLEEDGLAEETIVFYYGDHGPGFPRCKRSLYESGLRVPMIVAVPPKWKELVPGEPGSHSDRLVGFVDLAPTVLRLAGAEPPEWMDGSAFLGPDADPPKATLFGFRGRMDGRYDFSRAVRDKRWLYVRNYLIDRPGGSHNAYMFETPLTQEWKRLFDAGGLPDAQADYWRNHPAEELFDLRDDPDSLVNLAGEPAHGLTLVRMRGLLNQRLKATGDIGFLSEAELMARADGGSTADLVAEGKYDFDRIYHAADEASRVDEYGPGQFAAMLADGDSGVRYWGAIGLRFRGEGAVTAAAAELTAMLDDPNPSCRVAAAEALAGHGPESARPAALEALLRIVESKDDDFYAAVLAWNSLDGLDEAARPLLSRLRKVDLEGPLPKKHPAYYRLNKMLANLSAKTLADLEAAPK